MRSVITFVAAAILSATAAVAGPLDGRWGLEAADCEGAVAGDAGPAIFAGNKITYFESTCRITQITQIGGSDSSSWRAKVTCSGEGETWKADKVFAIERDGNGNARQLIDIDMKDGFVIVYQACK